MQLVPISAMDMARVPLGMSVSALMDGMGAQQIVRFGNVRLGPRGQIKRQQLILHTIEWNVRMPAFATDKQGHVLAFQALEEYHVNEVRVFLNSLFSYAHDLSSTPHSRYLSFRLQWTRNVHDNGRYRTYIR